MTKIKIIKIVSTISFLLLVICITMGFFASAIESEAMDYYGEYQEAEYGSVTETYYFDKYIDTYDTYITWLGIGGILLYFLGFTLFILLLLVLSIKEEKVFE